MSPEMHLWAASQVQVWKEQHVQTEGLLGQVRTHNTGLVRPMVKGSIPFLYTGGKYRRGLLCTGVPWGTGVWLTGGGFFTTSFLQNPPPFPSSWSHWLVPSVPHRWILLGVLLGTPSSDFGSLFFGRTDG